MSQELPEVCESCAELLESPLLIQLMREKLKIDEDMLVSLFHRNNHVLFGS